MLNILNDSPYPFSSTPFSALAQVEVSFVQTLCVYGLVYWIAAIKAGTLWINFLDFVGWTYQRHLGE